jgi:O-acetylhomoserine/O-acetylserine sulfhydrylase-like pyridoxal-dependent enzyme
MDGNYCTIASPSVIFLANICLSHSQPLQPFFVLRNAYAIALFLESHAGVKRVVYPGLPSHPQYELAKRQQHGFGAMITFFCVGGREQAAVFLQNVRLQVCDFVWT